jgi:hypothetical protein
LRIGFKLQPPTGDENDRKNKGMQEILRSLDRTQSGSHLIMVYPNLDVLREIYANYIIERLRNNEIVLMLPYYETVENVQSVLSKFRENKTDGGVSIHTYVKDGALVLVDAYEAFFGRKQSLDDTSSEGEIDLTQSRRDNIVSLLRIIQIQANKLKKDGITILVDLGCFFTNGGIDYLLKYEKSIPQTFKDKGIKQLCIYHQLDFENRLTNSTKAKLLDQHGRSVLMLDS